MNRSRPLGQGQPAWPTPLSLCGVVPNVRADVVPAAGVTQDEHPPVITFRESIVADFEAGARAANQTNSMLRRAFLR